MSKHLKLIVMAALITAALATLAACGGSPTSSALLPQQEAGRPEMDASLGTNGEPRNPDASQNGPGAEGESGPMMDSRITDGSGQIADPSSSPTGQGPQQASPRPIADSR